MSMYFKELSYPQVISEGMEYAVLNGGKRIRPNLLLLTLDILGKEKEMGFPTAIGIEMIHSYSLVHDDLPALDNDDYRRGKLTTHKKFGEAQGILIGDSLLTHAFYILTKKNKRYLSPDKIIHIVEKTADYAGINGMIGGQTIDIESEGKKIDLKTLKYIHSHKTGQLLKLPVECGCIIGDATYSQYEALQKYAELLGLAFQIKDDILDVEGDFEKLGKPIGSDTNAEKSTYPSIIGMVESKKLLNKTIEDAKKTILIEFEEDKAQLMLELADYIKDRDK
ncbi:MAG: polyprenyl synthetase family protein [Fusobacteriaceae bacterium]|nr:polyprenyl synthetase family protein [Fusobacteriaceae bacterium]